MDPRLLPLPPAELRNNWDLLSPGATEGAMLFVGIVAFEVHLLVLLSPPVLLGVFVIAAAHGSSEQSVGEQ